jgi:hypothetical protein
MPLVAAMRARRPSRAHVAGAPAPGRPPTGACAAPHRARRSACAGSRALPPAPRHARAARRPRRRGSAGRRSSTRRRACCHSRHRRSGRQPGHERRRRAPRGRLAVDRLARHVGHGRGRVSARTEAGVRSVALIVPDVTNPFFGHVMRGARAAVWRAGYTVALVDTANDRAWELSSYEALRGGPVDGFLVFGIEPPRRRGARGEKVVLIEAELPGDPSVRLDSEAGADAVMAHLLGPGHRRIGRVARRSTAGPSGCARSAGARRRRGGHRRRRDAARAQRDQLRRRPRRRARPAVHGRSADRALLRRRHPRRRRLPRRARAAPPHPARALRRRLRRSGLRARARPAAPPTWPASASPGCGCCRSRSPSAARPRRRRTAGPRGGSAPRSPGRRSAAAPGARRRRSASRAARRARSSGRRC